MKLIYTSCARDFLEEGLEFLLKSESVNNLILGLAQRIQEDGPREGEPFFYLLKDEMDTVVGAAMRSASIRPLALTSMNNQALIKIVEDLKNRDVELTGVVGPKKPVESFSNLWGRDFSEVMGQGIYECRKTISPAKIEGCLVQAQLDDDKALEAAISFGAGFIKECFPKHREPLIEARKAIENYVRKGAIFLWQCESGEFVSMAANHRNSPNGGTVGWVFTPKEKRGQGFASLVTFGVTEEIFKKGKSLANLFTDMSNPTSNSIYKKIGYQLIANSSHVEFI